MTLELELESQINSSEVPFYSDLESFWLLFGIEVSFWPNVGVKTTPPGQNDSFEFTVYTIIK